MGLSKGVRSVTQALSLTAVYLRWASKDSCLLPHHHTEPGGLHCQQTGWFPWLPRLPQLHACCSTFTDAHIQYTVLKHGAQTLYFPLLPLFLCPLSLPLSLLPLFLHPQLATRLLDAALDNNQWEVSFICCHSNRISTALCCILHISSR